ncbi:MAG: PhzF family phenazine biosynthesis protein [Bacteroidales bacterium]|nr:PhzF family phenazine biosynthesis protein [Bacteroidales bacterium]
MKYYIVDAFTDNPFGGNPAGVALLDGEIFPDDSLMRQIAAERAPRLRLHRRGQCRGDEGRPSVRHRCRQSRKNHQIY